VGKVVVVVADSVAVGRFNSQGSQRLKTIK